MPRSHEETKAWKRAHYHENRDRELARAKAYRARNREAINARKRAIYVYNPEKWRRSLHDLYGVTPEQYDALYEAQGGCCAICGRPENAKQNGRPVRLSVDHDHDSGIVRGLLCRRCNSAVGTLENTPFVEAISDYLARHGLRSVA